MIEPAPLVWRKTNAIRRKEGEKGYERKFALKTILKFYPKIEPLYQGILHENILETRLGKDDMNINRKYKKGSVVSRDLNKKLFSQEMALKIPDMKP